MAGPRDLIERDVLSNETSTEVLRSEAAERWIQARVLQGDILHYELYRGIPRWIKTYFAVVYVVCQVVGYDHTEIGSRRGRVLLEVFCRSTPTTHSGTWRRTR